MKIHTETATSVATFAKHLRGAFAWRAAKAGARFARTRPARLLSSVWEFLTLRSVPVDRLLTGGYAELKHCLLENSPHVRFLREFRDAERIDPTRFQQSDYYRHACGDIATFGSFFGITDPARIIDQAYYFLDMYRTLRNGSDLSLEERYLDRNGFHSRDGHLKVARVRGTEYFVIKDGHHRFAAYYVLGKRTVKVRIAGKAKITWSELQQRGLVSPEVDGSRTFVKELKQALSRFLRRLFIAVYRRSRHARFPDRVNVGFLSDEFSHPELMPFGGYGTTLKYVTDYCNAGPSRMRGDVLLCERKDIPSVLIKRYHNADVVFLPRWPGLRAQFQCSRLLIGRKINALIGLDHYRSYEFYLEQFPCIPWLVWIKDPKDRLVWEKLATVELEIRAWGATTIEELIEQGERRGESLRRMLDLSARYGRKVMFAAEAKHLADIARRLYALDSMQAFHWPKPIPVSADPPSFSSRPSFLFLARLDPIKRPWIFCELARRFPAADFYLAGTTHHPELMNPVLEPYRNISNLKFLGRVDGAEKDRLLKETWAVINTSIHEGVPVAMLEGFAFGKPTIAALDPDGLTSKFGIFVGERLGNGNDPETLDRFSAAIEQIITAFDKQGVGRKAQDYIARVHSFSYFESALLQALGVSEQAESRQ
ncbi:MAG TPA: glycosyltransferase [Bacteroidota bacterium]|nr:glycosyltransferase [Bacteroidota bacterium]